MPRISQNLEQHRQQCLRNSLHPILHPILSTFDSFQGKVELRVDDGLRAIRNPGYHMWDIPFFPIPHRATAQHKIQPLASMSTASDLTSGASLQLEFPIFQLHAIQSLPLVFSSYTCLSGATQYRGAYSAQQARKRQERANCNGPGYG